MHFIKLYANPCIHGLFPTAWGHNEFVFFIQVSNLQTWIDDKWFYWLLLHIQHAFIFLELYFIFYIKQKKSIITVMFLMLLKTARLCPNQLLTFQVEFSQFRFFSFFFLPWIEVQAWFPYRGHYHFTGMFDHLLEIPYLWNPGVCQQFLFWSNRQLSLSDRQWHALKCSVYRRLGNAHKKTQSKRVCFLFSYVNWRIPEVFPFFIIVDSPLSNNIFQKWFLFDDKKKDKKVAKC